MRLSTRVLLLFLACYTVFAQPDLPACWLMEQACSVHPHFSQDLAGIPHSHDYLLDLSISSGVPAVAIALIPLAMLIAAVLNGALFLELTRQLLCGTAWDLDPKFPPPRRSLSSI
jgi:hypothetical protein